MGIDIMRISPQPKHMAEIISAFDAERRGEMTQPDMTAWATDGLVDGYWFGEPGIASHHQAALAQLQGA